MGLGDAPRAHCAFDHIRRRSVRDELVVCRAVATEHSREMVEGFGVSSSGHSHDPVGEFRLSIEQRQSQRHYRFTRGGDQALSERFVTPQA